MRNFAMKAIVAVSCVGLLSVAASRRGSASSANKGGEGDTASFAAWHNRPSAPFSNGEESFQAILSTLKTKYIEQGLSEDDFYRAASQGLLTNIDPARSDWNKLLTPTEYRELLGDLNGEIVGVGLEISFEAESGMGLVTDVIAGSPAQAAGLMAGDRVLQVDGQGFGGKQLRDLVYAIRGKIGTSVAITLLRDARTFTVNLVRSEIKWDEVEAVMTSDAVALVTIHSFTKNTPARVRTGLTELAQQHPKALLVDLRGCTGGSFDSAVATSGLFLPPGATVAKLKGRDGAEEVKLAAGGPVLSEMPVSVLIDGETKSGCELMGGALQQSLGATLIGAHSYGKWSMQTVDELANHYAIKFTVAGFYPPNGADLSGKGLTPDVQVPGDSAAVRKLQRLAPAQRLEQDVQLQAARNLLNLAL